MNISLIFNNIRKSTHDSLLVMAIAIMALSSCSSITKMSVGKPKLESVQMTSFTGALVNLNMPVSNPTAKDLKIESIEGSIINDNIEVAQFSLASPLEIPAGFKGYLTLPLNAKITSLTAVSQVAQIASEGDLSISSFIESSTIPATVTYTLGSRTKSRKFSNLLKFAK